MSPLSSTSASVLATNLANSGPRPPSHLRASLPNPYPPLPTSPRLHLTLTSPLNIDAHINLPRRRLHPPRRLRSRRQHRPPLPRRRPPPPRGAEDVREARPRVG